MARNKGKARGSVFGDVSGLRPGRSVFNLSYEKKFTCDMGALIPVLCEEVLPGDIWKVRNQIVIRLAPMVTPVLHEINVYVHYFFVPYRLLWPGSETDTSWEAFISGGPNGTDASVLPTWTVVNKALGSLWDYLGFPIGVAGSANFKPMQFPMNAYNMIYNEFYRDQQQIAKVSLTQENILKRAWEKDYHTSALPWTQRGTPPALPFSGSAVWSGAISGANNPDRGTTQMGFPTLKRSGADATIYAGLEQNSGASWGAAGQISDQGGNAQAAANLLAALNANTLTAVTFGVNDLRLSFQIQKWMERNARAGVRYPEYLNAHFGVSPRDERLQRPEYLGGTRSPIIVSEVLQTSATGLTGGSTPTGNMAGHGIGVHQGEGCRYRAEEFGVIMGIMSVMPRTGYSQGINRQWLRTTRYDFYSPEFAHLSEQPVFQGELYLDTVDADNLHVFGYQGRHDEMRFKPNMVCGQFAYGQSLHNWHMCREFGSAPALNQAFIECDGTTAGFKRCFADTVDHVCYVSFGNLIKAIRPMPFEPTPGLLDHF